MECRLPKENLKHLWPTWPTLSSIKQSQQGVKSNNLRHYLSIILSSPLCHFMYSILNHLWISIIECQPSHFVSRPWQSQPIFTFLLYFHCTFMRKPPELESKRLIWLLQSICYQLELFRENTVEMLSNHSEMFNIVLLSVHVCYACWISLEILPNVRMVYTVGEYCYNLMECPSLVH